MSIIRGVKFWRLIGAGLLLAGALFFLYLVREIFTPFILAALIAYLLKPVVKALEKRGIKRYIAIFLLYIVIIISFLPVLWFVLPQLLRELNDFIERLPHFTADVERMLQELYTRYSRINVPTGIRVLVDDAVLNISYMFQEGARKVSRSILELISGFASFLLAPVLAYYFLRDSEHIGRTASRLLPVQIKEDVLGLWTEIDAILTNFIRGHLLISLIVGFLTGLGLAVVGSKYAVILGIIVGLADLIPYFGPIIGAVPVVALSLLESKKAALYALIVVILVQQIESCYLSPRILSGSVGLHPLVIIFVLLAGVKLWGVIGLLLAVPLTAIGRVFVRFIWARIVSS